MNPADASPWIQFGALGIVAFVVWRLVAWVLGSLNGKLDRLTKATEATTAATRENTGAIKELTRVVERMDSNR